MSDRRWATRLKTKLLRRSSLSSKNHHSFTATTAVNSFASALNLNNHHHGDGDEQHSHLNHGRRAAVELPSADPNFPPTATSAISTNPNTLTSQPLPPALSSTGRPSISSFTESQYTPDEVASAPGSIGGHYFLVPEYSQPCSPSRGPRQRQPDAPPDPSSIPPVTRIRQTDLQDPQAQHQIPRRRSDTNHDRERARSGSNRRSFPSELLNFPLPPPPSRKAEQSSPAPPSTPPTPKVDRSLISNPARDRLPAPESQPNTPLNAVAENPSGEPSYHSFPLPPSSFPKRPSLNSRRQSLLPASHQHLINSLLDTGSFSETDGPGNKHLSTSTSGMGSRKIWVKRPGGSATLVPTSEDALVDELRDQVVLKYANSLGKTFDAPDIIIRIATREGTTRQATPDRILSPEEPLCPVLDSCYPGGQTIEEALIIEIPQRRTPRPSPRHPVYYHHSEPGEHGDYFPLMPANPNVPTPSTHASNTSTGVSGHPAPSISILTTGMAPALPSPSGRTARHSRRPPLTRHTTNSPKILGQAPSAKDNASQNTIPSQAAPPSIPTPPGPPPESPQTKSLTPPTRGASPRPRPGGKPKKTNRALNGAFGGLIEGTVPPINVLIVEDNNINQRLLEAFMKRLSVRWKCAGNGEEAVRRWREGGFHLVLMDIQLPVMNGLDATKEIRRLERLNGIGVFPKKISGRSSAASANATCAHTLSEEDTLHDLSLFKSPVIIVALTASSLQSDRHEALAAGCNDFLTKPVRFEWMEKKVTEWGCMQALIDFEGWRKWRGFADDSHSSGSSDGSSSPLHRSSDATSRRSSPAGASSAAPTKKTEGKSLRHHKRLELMHEDSSGAGSGDGSGSPASLHMDVPPVKDDGA
ncbi:hypothetical protein ARAM_007017 [Aspergillus rambellii]|uniref:Response regulatory domain-containing protein n=3 Tax=Aspergillus subgen. Nidulantes TaxID=2720870 RepID=A0A0F8WSS3_9EURO|nr:hypothetical protein ARAM_007017 [Aspergillus rambellii]KKK18974.1 hypothetical protein AOCH_005556 [Aspergillus ochraceoroseus]